MHFIIVFYRTSISCHPFAVLLSSIDMSIMSELILRVQTACERQIKNESTFLMLLARYISLLRSVRSAPSGGFLGKGTQRLAEFEIWAVLLVVSCQISST